MAFFDWFKKKNKNSKALETLLGDLKRNEILLEPREASCAPDASKLGGAPWLPADFVWPRFTDEEGVSRPLSFLCQINVSEVKEYDTEGLLPEKGLLSFFYECESFCWGFHPKEKDCVRVFYYETTEGFRALSVPEELSEDYRVPEIALGFRKQDSTPSYEELSLHADGDYDWKEYDLARGATDEVDRHKLLGYADLIQGEILSDCERIHRGISCGSPEDYEDLSDEEEADVLQCAKDWTLLLQLGTLTKGDWELMWGDCGSLYFYIRKEDLKNCRFDRIWFSLQCG